VEYSPACRGECSILKWTSEPDHASSVSVGHQCSILKIIHQCSIQLASSVFSNGGIFTSAVFSKLFSVSQTMPVQLAYKQNQTMPVQLAYKKFQFSHIKNA
jgi:hypothetical protein